jgi:hypothetical protein
LSTRGPLEAALSIFGGPRYRFNMTTALVNVVDASHGQDREALRNRYRGELLGLAVGLPALQAAVSKIDDVDQPILDHRVAPHHDLLTHPRIGIRREPRVLEVHEVERLWHAWTRATDTIGNVETTFTRGRNLSTFEVKRKR